MAPHSWPAARAAKSSAAATTRSGSPSSTPLPIIASAHTLGGQLATEMRTSKHKKRESMPPPVRDEGPHNPVARRHITDVNLMQIRDDALAARIDLSRTIAELESWRDELDGTIAFLKAQRK